MGRKRKGNENEQPKKPNNEDLSKKVKDAKKFSSSWMGNEIQLLLMTALDFKSQCEYEGTNWDSKRSKDLNMSKSLNWWWKNTHLEDQENYPSKNV